MGMYGANYDTEGGRGGGFVHGEVKGGAKVRESQGKGVEKYGLQCMGWEAACMGVAGLITVVWRMTIVKGAGKGV